ncbi:Histidine protein methyltransferase 1 [Smittium culicis]|uniref:protein-histidine N-methyltransferase n=1 Tax=Smittium culicis TaxID=133412 RepID=A0A1R1Y045_9FUNG|nr:Histidine protein methyltransferase 1 [Smittium culicis]
MSFSFNFQDPETDVGMEIDEGIQTDDSVNFSNVYNEEFRQFNLSVPLINSISANQITYGPNKDLIIYKRLLSDVKMQLALEDDMDPNSLDIEKSSENQFTTDTKKVLSIASGNSDVIKGVYEGGFKTWECSFDLLEYISSTYSSSDLENISVLELGCGSAIPSMHLLKTTKLTKVHLQDYNAEVLKYITLPNVLLNTIMSNLMPAASSEYEDESPIVELDLDEIRGKFLLDFVKKVSSSAEYSSDLLNRIETTEKLQIIDEISKLQDSKYYELSDSEISLANEILLKEIYITTPKGSEEVSEISINDINAQTNYSRVKFFSGSWSNLLSSIGSNNENQYHAESNANPSYDLILTSETIYDTESQISLYNCIHSLLRKPDNNLSPSAFKPAAFVAAKSVYFGLSGSVLSFIDLVNSKNHFKVTRVWNSQSGIQRDILKLEWL